MDWLEFAIKTALIAALVWAAANHGARIGARHGVERTLNVTEIRVRTLRIRHDDESAGV